MAYTQVPVDGLRIVLVHEGIQYPYHSGGFTDTFLCAPSSDQHSPGLPQIDITPSGTDPEADEQAPAPEPTLTTQPIDTTKETIPTEQPGGPGDPDV